MALIENISEPSTCMAAVEAVSCADIESSKEAAKKLKTLRKFEEEKKLYACDSQNLHKLYEKEWKRIENLATNRRRKDSRSRDSNFTTEMLSKQLKSLRLPDSYGSSATNSDLNKKS
ncbi:hypothetical protein LOAG_06180 [Loa loa]|nr:hypothetical protein LOAG_06180 [Loa loa]EFO22305.1 hypothetical protein LOAG_06180 [Loa loa]